MLDFENITTTSAPIIQDCPVVHDWPDITLGSVIMVATVISYFPQYIKMVKTSSIEGLSHIMIILANVSAFANFEGTILLDAHYYGCCQQNNLTKSDCINTFLPVFQMAIPWLGSFVYYLIFVIVCEKDSFASHGKEMRTRYSFLAYLILGPIVTGLVGTILLISSGELNEHPLLFGNLLNIGSSTICFVMWMPQIWKTYQKKEIGSLSLITLAIQGPGSLLIFVYQDILNKNSWSVGVPFLFSGIQILILLVMGYYYTYGIPRCLRCCCCHDGYSSLDDTAPYQLSNPAHRYVNPCEPDDDPYSDKYP